MYASENTSKQNCCANKEGCQHWKACQRKVCEDATCSPTDGGRLHLHHHLSVSCLYPQDQDQRNMWKARIKTQEKIPLLRQRLTPRQPISICPLFLDHFLVERLLWEEASPGAITCLGEGWCNFSRFSLCLSLNFFNWFVFNSWKRTIPLLLIGKMLSKIKLGTKQNKIYVIFSLNITVYSYEQFLKSWTLQIEIWIIQRNMQGGNISQKMWKTRFFGNKKYKSKQK